MPLKMTRYGQTRNALNDHSLAPKKRFGQNFLVNSKTAINIVKAAKVSPDDTIIEVGVGLGALTQPLAETARNVIGLEIDSGIVRFHEEENDLPENVTILHQDVLKADFDEIYRRCGGPLKIVANLPYSISNPFIFKLIENRHLVESAVIMLQKEVGERLMAKPSTKEYGIPSVILQSCATISKLMTLKPAEFHPRPKIDSVVIRMVFHADKPVSETGSDIQFPLFQKIIRQTFNQRRKTISNTLTNCWFFSPDKSLDKQVNKRLTLEAIEGAEISPTVRPEVLTVEQFIRLAVSFEKIINREKGSC